MAGRRWKHAGVHAGWAMADASAKRTEIGYVLIGWRCAASAAGAAGRSPCFQDRRLRVANVSNFACEGHERATEQDSRSEMLKECPP